MSSSLITEYCAFNGRYRPTYWGAVPLPMIAPLSGFFVLALLAVVLLTMKTSIVEGILGGCAAAFSGLCLVILYKRFKAMNREELAKIELQATRLKHAKDVAV